MRARLLALMLAGIAGGSPAQEPGPVHADWQILCEEGAACRMSQTLLAPEDGTQVLRARVFAGDGATMVLSTPLGVFLKPGIVVQVDSGRPRAYGYEICNLDGCHAGIALDADLLQAMRRGRVAEVSFFDGAKNRIAVPLSLAGFTAAFGGLAE